MRCRVHGDTAGRHDEAVDNLGDVACAHTTTSSQGANHYHLGDVDSTQRVQEHLRVRVPRAKRCHENEMPCLSESTPKR